MKLKVNDILMSAKIKELRYCIKEINTQTNKVVILNLNTFDTIEITEDFIMRYVKAGIYVLISGELGKILYE